MASKNSQTKSQPVQQNNHPDGALPTLSDNDIEEFVRFFQRLAEWDRQHKLNQPRCAGISCADSSRVVVAARGGARERRAGERVGVDGSLSSNLTRPHKANE
jgi:hypothetical protein